MTTGEEPLTLGSGDALEGGGPTNGDAVPPRRRSRLIRLGVPLAVLAVTMAGLFVALRLREPSRVSADQAVATALGHLRWQHPELHGLRVVSIRYENGSTRVDEPFGGVWTTTDAAHPFAGWVLGVTAPSQAHWAVIHGSVLVIGATNKVESSSLSEQNPPAAGVG
jgi:hypothetical protein